MRMTLHSFSPLLLLLGMSASALQAQPSIRLISAAPAPATGLEQHMILAPAPTALPPIKSPTADSRPTLASTAGSTTFLQGTVWAAVAARHGLDPVLLYGVALKESRRAAGAHASVPWPYTLRGPAGAQYHRSRAEAAQALARLTARHRPLAIDVGLMQVNLRWHGDKVADPAQLLDARTNLEIAAGILVDALHSAPGDLELGIGHYHHWHHEAIARAYGRSVLKMVRAMSAG
jgi:hypothetical protein